MASESFEQQVKRYWPDGDPLNQASQFLRSEQMDVALKLCRMYLVEGEIPREKAVRWASEQEGNLRKLFDKVVIERNLLLVKLRETEQQLAQAREELRIALAQRQDKAALLTAAEEYIKDLLPLVGENAAMRALLEEWLTALEDAGYLPFVYENRCRWCHSTTQHHDFCLLARSRAFLAAHPQM